MRVPVEKIDNLVAVQRAGSTSSESIEAGIRFIMDVANCVCKSTKVFDRETIADVVKISM